MTMYFENLASLIHMGGHGVYVWSAYGMGLLIIVYNIVSPLRFRERIVSQIQRQVRSSQSRGWNLGVDKSLSLSKSSNGNRNQRSGADREQKLTIARQQEDSVNIKAQGAREGEVE
ncbi:MULTISPECIES: heme exporter protein CcmD [unclassified Endozoicomonas]|uniref:heme exporter protein CcmD n=1 Tax=unclassified Endozoicomonas TaxID=2644528 RepID=UPI00214790FD|nr:MULTISPECIES: heme exporter protein CcmD [unclassified Endozoicomonas]